MTAFHHPQEENYQESKDMNKQRKSIFGSKTFWGIIFTSTAAIAPIVGNNVDKFLDEETRKDINYGQDAAQIVVIMCGAAASIVGRVEAKSSIYTPKGIPGPNINDLD